MHRIAIFVDAGYLFAQGSTALTGSKKARSDLVLDAPSVIAELKAVATLQAAACSLLRIYWYDGATGGARLTADQALLAKLDDVKVRLGFINSAGQQKGVDSLIVTDLIELARQRAICDAVLLSGDEDVRVGVQIAQNYGVRIHLLGISPARGVNLFNCCTRLTPPLSGSRSLSADFFPRESARIIRFARLATKSPRKTDNRTLLPKRFGRVRDPILLSLQLRNLRTPFSKQIWKDFKPTGRPLEACLQSWTNACCLVAEPR